MNPPEDQDLDIDVPEDEQSDVEQDESDANPESKKRPKEEITTIEKTKITIRRRM